MVNQANEQQFKVVVNEEEQHALWPQHLDTPLGWKETGHVGDKASCMAYVSVHWSDITPLSSR